MLVLAAVPAAQFHKLRRAAAPRFPVVHAQDWDVALATIRTRPVELAALGGGRGAARPRRAADRAAGGGACPRGPPHLRALVRAPRPAVAAPLPRGGARAVRPPPAAGPRLYGRRRRPAPRLRPDQDAAAARPLLPRPHRRGNAAHPRAPPGARAHRPGLRPAAPGASHGVMSGTPHPPPAPPPPSTLLIVEDETALRRVLAPVPAR